MGSKEKFLSMTSADHGFDDVGLAQPSGTVSGVAQVIAGRWAGRIVLTVNSTALMKRGQPINIGALDSVYSGATRVLRVISSTKVIVNIAYSTTPVDVTGTWDTLGGASAWDAFMPIGANLTGANITFTFWYPDRQGGDENAVDYLNGNLYAFPGIIKTIQIATAGNVRLIRSASLRPGGLAAQ